MIHKARVPLSSPHAREKLMHRDSSWDPLPVRGTAQLTCQFLLTTVYAPVHWVLCTAFTLVYLVFGYVLELISWIPGVESGYMKLADLVYGRILPWWPRWFVSLPELRHEGDVAFYQARVEAKLARWSDNWKYPHTEIPLRGYRAVGAGYVAERASEFGWRLTDGRQQPAAEVKLTRITYVQPTS